MKNRYYVCRNILGGLLLLACAYLSTLTVLAEADNAKCGRREFEFVELEDKMYKSSGTVYIPTEEEKAYWTGFSSDYYYSQLTEAEKAIWNGLEAECIRLAEKDDDSEGIAAVQFDNEEFGINNEELKELLYIFYYSNPQYYFLLNRYGFRYSGSSYMAYLYLYPEFCDGEVRKNATAAFCQKIDGWVNEVANAGREEQKVKQAHDIIATNTVYNFGYYDQSSYSMVCEGQTVCAGYAAALQLLLNPNGIPTAEVTSQDHAWNIVKIHNQWYGVDVTWDDTDSEMYEPVAYNYYLKSDAILQLDNGSHMPEDVWICHLPELNCDSTMGTHYYEPSYFDESGFTYFKVNDNVNLGQRCVTIVDMAEEITMALAVPSISHEGIDYRVLDVSNDERTVPHYDIRTSGGTWNKMQYRLPDGTVVKDAFFCDGQYTYYLMMDGTPMKDRLTYHPDGKHIIYFDPEGHEVFSDFAYISQSIAGDKVDDVCFFDIYGHLYVDVVTYDKTGTKLYYANPYGVLERKGWFQFSDSVLCADGNSWPGAAGGYGYANEDGNLMRDAWTYDWENRLCYMQGNGVALYE